MTLVFKHFIYYPVDSFNFDISVIEFGPFNEVVDLWNNNYLFKDKEEDNTIICYLCFATHGGTEEEKEKNMKTYLLLFKNYSSDLQKVEDGEFEPTSNEGMFSGVDGFISNQITRNMSAH